MSRAEIQPPSVADLRIMATQSLEVLDKIELAQALKADDRIKSLLPFAEWIAEAPNGKLYLCELAKMAVYLLQEKGADAELKKVLERVVDAIIKK